MFNHGGDSHERWLSEGRGDDGSCIAETDRAQGDKYDDSTNTKVSQKFHEGSQFLDADML